MTEIRNLWNVLENGKDLVCVVRYMAEYFVHQGMVLNPPQNPAVLQQVCVKPSKVKGDLIRFGETPGDEIMGWQWIGSLEVVAVLVSERLPRIPRILETASSPELAGPPPPTILEGSPPTKEKKDSC